MDNLRVEHYPTPLDLFEANKQFDDSFTNFCLGSIADRYEELKGSDMSNTFQAAVFAGDQLLVLFVRFNWDPTYFLSSPSSAHPVLTDAPAVLSAALALLARSTLAHLPSPLSLDKLSGPEELITPFISAWLALLPHLHLRAVPGPLIIHAAHCTPASLSLSLSPLPPPDRALAPGYTLAAAQTPADVQALVPLYRAFVRHSPWPRTLSDEDCVRALTPCMLRGLLFLCRAKGEGEGGEGEGEGEGRPVALGLLGRSTARTVALRNVYVLEAHRRRGIAEALVRAVVRYFLGVGGGGLEGGDGEAEAEGGEPRAGRKEEVCLMASEPGPGRVYRRVGFMFPDEFDLEGETTTGTGTGTGGVDPATGRKAWVKLVSYTFEDDKGGAVEAA